MCKPTCRLTKTKKSQITAENEEKQLWQEAAHSNIRQTPAVQSSFNLPAVCCSVRPHPAGPEWAARWCKPTSSNTPLLSQTGAAWKKAKTSLLSNSFSLLLLSFCESAALLKIFAEQQPNHICRWGGHISFGWSWLRTTAGRVKFGLYRSFKYFNLCKSCLNSPERSFIYSVTIIYEGASCVFASQNSPDRYVTCKDLEFESRSASLVDLTNYHFQTVIKAEVIVYLDYLTLLVHLNSTVIYTGPQQLVETAAPYWHCLIFLHYRLFFLELNLKSSNH